MNLTYTGIELQRVGRDYISMFFIAVLPAFMYIVFGAAMAWSDAPIGNGNAAMYTMISMAAFGAVTATVGVGGMAAVERMQGWGRQLGLTPMSDAQYVVTKAAVAFVIAIIPITLIYVLGYFTGATGSPAAWWLSALAVVVGAAIFSLYGLLFGLLFRSEAAVGAASGSLVIFAFLGNIFFPLSGAMLTVAQFTPLYGFVALARYPLTEGMMISTTGPPTQANDLWIPLINLVAWAIIFGVLTLLMVRRGRSRQ